MKKKKTKKKWYRAKDVNLITLTIGMKKALGYPPLSDEELDKLGKRIFRKEQLYISR